MDQFECDDGKAAANLAKHGVDFADAIDAFADPHAIVLLDDSEDEERFVILGTRWVGAPGLGRLHVAR